MGGSRAAPRRASPRAFALIKRFEGYRPVPYRDPAGFLTVGYGHRVLPHDRLGFVTPAEAQALLEADVARVEHALETVVEAGLTQAQHDAVVAFAYNVGPAAFGRSRMLRLLNAGDAAGAAGEFARWVYAGGRKLQGLVNRRAAERALFLGEGPAGDGGQA